MLCMQIPYFNSETCVNLATKQYKFSCKIFLWVKLNLLCKEPLTNYELAIKYIYINIYIKYILNI